MFIPLLLLSIAPVTVSHAYDFIDPYELTPETLYQTTGQLPLSTYPPDHPDPWENIRALKFLPAGTIIRFVNKYYYGGNKSFFYFVRADVHGAGKLKGWVNPSALFKPGLIKRYKK